MNFREHSIAGTITGLIVGGTAYYITKNPEIGTAFAVITLAGSLLSDVDCGSIPSRIFAWVGIVLSVFLMYKGHNRYAGIVGLFYMSLSAGKHRGFTHKWIVPIMCLAIGVAGFYYPQFARYILFIPLGIGISVHLCLDKIPPYKII